MTMHDTEREEFYARARAANAGSTNPLIQAILADEPFLDDIREGLAASERGDPGITHKALLEQEQVRRSEPRA